MEKYYTPRQRRRMRSEKRKKFFTALAIVLSICLVIAIVLLVNKLRPGVQISRDNSFGSDSVADSKINIIPDYHGKDYIVLNEGVPSFNEWDLENITGEHFSDLDSLGRCGVAYALLDRSMMPTEPRGEIGQIKPSGWVQKKYEGIVDSQPPYLYNRCHLIAYALSGQNANEKNLITGTRYMNATTMLQWEEKVMRYLDRSNNHVLYRVTPYFKDEELLNQVTLVRNVITLARSIRNKNKVKNRFSCFYNSRCICMYYHTFFCFLYTRSNAEK